MHTSTYVSFYRSVIATGPLTSQVTAIKMRSIWDDYFNWTYSGFIH